MTPEQRRARAERRRRDWPARKSSGRDLTKFMNALREVLGLAPLERHDTRNKWRTDRHDRRLT